MEITVCTDISRCEDGKAPYYLDGQCCQTCMYASALSLLPSPPNGEFRTNRTDKLPKPKIDTWSDWSLWSECSRSCGGGRQSRMRECLTEGAAKLNCTGDVVELKDCNTHPCPGECVDCLCMLAVFTRR